MIALFSLFWHENGGELLRCSHGPHYSASLLSGGSRRAPCIVEVLIAATSRN